MKQILWRGCDFVEPSEAAKRHVEAVMKHQKKLDAITIRPPKAIGKMIRDAAKESPEKKLQQYILTAIFERMERDKAAQKEEKEE